MKIINIVGARPNFMKVAPVHAALLARGHDAQLIHTGQHYDENMSRVFFEQLGMARPSRNLGVGSGSHAVQTARVMEAFEAVVLEARPDLVLVAGDINSTVACALVAVKLDIRVAHLEAGLRSFDRRMPEETNRVLTDHMSDILLTPSADADLNLQHEGVPAERVFRVGNAMIDSLRAHLNSARATDIVSRLGQMAGSYALVTLHRPENVDSRSSLERLLHALGTLSRDLDILFPVHPRTRSRIGEFGLDALLQAAPRIHLIEPLGYLEFLALEDKARLVLTDSGGIQEETTALGVPCLTLRENTERPITVTEGTNLVIGTAPERMLREVGEILAGRSKAGRVPELWDGHAADRVADVIDGL